MLAARFTLSLTLFLWTSYSFFDSLDGVCRSRLTLLESEYCPTSFPTVNMKVPYRLASPGPKEDTQVLYQVLRAVFPKEPYSAA